MKKTFIRITSLILALLLMLQMSGVSAVMVHAAEEPVVAETATIPEDASSPVIVGEDISKREESVKHFRLSDGSFTAVSYGVPVHYADESGTWQDINNMPILTTDTDSRSIYQIANGISTTAFASTLATGELLTVSYEDTSVSMSLLDTAQALNISNESQVLVASEDISALGLTYNRSSSAQLEGNSSEIMTLSIEQNSLDEDFIPQNLGSSIIYENVYPGIDIRYTTWSYTIKEEIIVRTLHESYRYDFLLSLENLMTRYNTDGSISLLDNEGTEMYFIPAPYMIDSAGEFSDQVNYTLTQVDSGIILTVEADADWIESEERQLPVYIDPTISTSLLVPTETESDDIYSTYAHPAYPDESMYGKVEIHTGCSSSYTSSPYTVYLYFNDIPELPAGSIISEAQLRIYMNRYSGSGCSTMPVGVYPVTNEIPEGNNAHSWIKSITYNSQPGYDENNIIDFVNTSNATTGYLYWNITNVATEWYTGEDNRMLALAGIGSCTPSNYASQSYYIAAFSRGPVLQITYRNSYGLEDYYTYQSMGVGDAGTAYIADATGQLKVVTNLLGYSSGTNPFSLNLVYNSDYFMGSSGDYRPPQEMGINMDLGSGWTLDCLQTVTVSADSTDYLEHRDGDGTIHYYKRAYNSSDYYDEDGLRMYISDLGANLYRLDNSLGSYFMFKDDVLIKIRDSDQNFIYVNYTDKRVSTITQSNRGGTEITLASFTYSDDTLTSVTDAAGNIYSLGYTDGKLTSLQKNNTVIAQFGYLGYRISQMIDSESNYALNFDYNSEGKITQYSESVESASGALVEICYPGQGQITYKTHIKSDNSDLYYNYLFDSAGRTVNAYVTDESQNIYGASNAVYSFSNSTDKRTNRILRSASTGVVAQQLLRDAGLEIGSWDCEGTSVTTEKPRTGIKALTGSSGNEATTVYAQKSSEPLTQGKTYTFSGYVNTEGMDFPGAGIYLKVTDSNSNTWTGRPIAYATSPDIDSGWTRLSVAFTAKTSGIHTLSIHCDGATGTFYADDFQLETGEAPSAYNMVENGSMLSNSTWTLENGAEVSSGTLSIETDPTTTGSIAYQDIPVNLPGSQTYVLAGWAEADSAPNNHAAAIGGDITAIKQFGLRAILTYSDGTTETHSIPFHPDVEQWQFVSYALIPQSPAKTVASIRVVCVYEQNFGTALFDNITLVQETAQAMSYDENGNLLSVSTTGLASDVNTYSAGYLIIKKATAGSGTYSYSYGTNTNSYQLNAVTHGYVKESYGVNAMGNVTTTTLMAMREANSKPIVTSSTYSSDGNRLLTSTDAAGNTVTYTYDTPDSIMLGLPTSVTAPNGTVTNTAYDSDGRVTQTSVANAATLLYNYSNGNLSSITRTGGNSSQIYNLDYDDFGNTTSISVGDRTLASYAYNADFLLETQTDGNGDVVTYTYDNLGRVKTATYSDGLILTYTYTGEGSLYSVTTEENNEVTTYIYNYDSLGRLVSSERQDGEATAIRARQEYDTTNRVVRQAWQLADDSYDEYYTYNSSIDGSLNTFTTATGQTLKMNYDGLRRLTSITGGIYGKSYTYRNATGTKTTMQIASVAYDLPTDQSFAYTYDNMGNIATYTDANGAMTYTYDAQGQLLSATRGTTTYSYTYDSVGNILEANGHSYTYGDPDWKDLLTNFDGETISYDDAGNPTSYYNGTRWTFGWAQGRRLTTATDGTTNLSFTYDSDGLRTSKTVDGVKHTYLYASGKLLRETYGDTTIDFFYDASGNAYALKYNGTVYYYITNLQGDIMSIVDGTGAVVASYEYDPYGNVITATGDLAEINPLRYRGYYFDSETGMYYLQSRYYDPEIGRFINADVFASTGQGILGYNMFAYCGNNPVIGYDSSGYANGWGVFVGTLLIVAGVGCIVASWGTATLAGSALLVQAGVMLGVTGAVTTNCAAEESVMVMDISASDPVTTDKKGFSLVIDFEDSSFDLYGHYGYTASTGGSPVTFSVGKVYNYEDSGDYAEEFVNVGGSTGWIGGDYCRAPDLNPDSCNARSITFGLPGTKGLGAYVGADYFYQIGYWE